MAANKYEGKLPTLHSTGSNLKSWMLCLSDFAIENESQEILDDSHTPPAPSAAEYKKYRKKQARLRLHMIHSLPLEFYSQLELNADTTPLTLLADIKALFTDLFTSEHQILRQEAKSTFFTTSLSADDYIQAHQNIRTKMRNSGYPNISDENITIEFIIKGLEHHDQYKHLPDTWVETNTVPNTIRDIRNRLKSIEARIKSRNTTAANNNTRIGLETPSKKADPQQESSCQRGERGRGRGSRNRGRGNPYTLITLPFPGGITRTLRVGSIPPSLNEYPHIRLHISPLPLSQPTRNLYT